MRLLLLVLFAIVLVLFWLGQYTRACEVKPRLVVFSATWCGACKDAKPIVDKIEAKGYKVTRYDADADPEILKQYKVKSLPTFIIYKGGEVVARTNYVEVVQTYFD